MDRRAYVLTTKERRRNVAELVARLPQYSRVEIKGAQRTVDQNSALWPALTDISEQHEHHGMTLSPADWRLVFLDYFWRTKGEELRLVPNLSGSGFVPLDGRSTSDLSVPEMSEFLDLIHATGAEWGVQFHEDGQGGSGANNPRSEAA